MPGGDEERGGFANLRAEFRRLLVNSDGVQIDDAEDALVVALNLGPVLQGSEIITDVKLTRWAERQIRPVLS